MTSFAHPGTRGLSTVFGLMMVGSAAVGSHGLAVVVGLAAVIAVGVAAVFRLAATLAVVLSVVMIVVSGPTHVLAALSGFAPPSTWCADTGPVLSPGAGRRPLPPLVSRSLGWLRRRSRCKYHGCRWRHRWPCWLPTCWPPVRSRGEPPAGRSGRCALLTIGYQSITWRVCYQLITEPSSETSLPTSGITSTTIHRR
ncbi:hypothetical protein BBG46_16470 [Mycobacterium tuberculosis variant caprae]|nr:hypothetical protein BBG46_16470 [Mycobacterium tuberculosis variant caprae]CEJ51865.1 Integral membrane protein [Mycobacterium tuberculosis variant caprae]SGO58869.1 integral membrane protein [Mycobacterium tuberculosis]